MYLGNAYRITEKHSPGALATLRRPAKYSNLAPGDGADESSSKAPDDVEAASPNLNIAIIVPKGYINLNDEEDVLVVAVRIYPRALLSLAGV